MILRIDALLMRYPAHGHFLPQVTIFLEKQTKDRMGALYFPLFRDEELNLREINKLSKGYQGSLCQIQELVSCSLIPKLQL